jgi:DNA repair protein SbcD/Mre11
MKILHTSDWHIGRTLYGKKRYEEFEAFLEWLSNTLQSEQVDILLVSGDVFDTSTPSNRAQELYYRFLCRIAQSTCRHIVIIAGNHDSPTFLNAPREILRALDVHVIGQASLELNDQVIVLENNDKGAEAIICAVPYLRDRDIRSVEAGESIEDKDRKLIDGITQHYDEVARIADQKRKDLNLDIPLIAMGHLFAAGGKTVEGDGVRELYVGSLAHVSAHIFPDCLDYVALGHLHVPQTVNGSELIRYSGSPIPMGFGEAGQEKSVCLVEFIGAQANLKQIKVPVFQKLVRLQGDWNDIQARLLELSVTKVEAWLEIIYQSDEVLPDLRERLDEAIKGSQLEILRVKNTRIIDRVLGQFHENETLDDLDIHDVFERCLSTHEISDEQRRQLRTTYQEAVTSLHDEDVRAE